MRPGPFAIVCGRRVPDSFQEFLWPSHCRTSCLTCSSGPARASSRRSCPTVRRDPHVALNVVDPDNTSRYFAVRGRVVATTTQDGAENIDELSRKYLGQPYPNFGGHPETRMIITIEADSVRGTGAR